MTTQQQVSGLDPLALLDHNFADNAAFLVLDLLDVALNDDAALGDNRTGDGGIGSPAADTRDQGDHDDEAGKYVAP